MAGALCVLCAHNRPYAARARGLAGVVLGMLAGLAAALVTASLTGNPVVLVTMGALLVAVQKTLCGDLRTTADTAAGEWWQGTGPRSGSCSPNGPDTVRSRRRHEAGGYASRRGAGRRRDNSATEDVRP